MIKLIPPGSWAFGRPAVEEVKVAAARFRGADFLAFVKRASHPLALWVRDHPPLPGEVYVHNIALGSTEKYGANRNFDGYPNDMLKRDHPTFEKFARWYRLHRNNDQRISYGVIKKAWYNPELERVETIAALNATKEAAERNGGLVADRELDTLHGNRDLAVSQSVRVPYDVCTSCGNKARHRGEYCTAQTCKYGGCRDHLGRVADDGTHMFVQNPSGVFFDLSNVSQDVGSRGADRTAFVTGKVAGHYLPGGAELAERLGLVAPDYLLAPRTLAAVTCLRKLASLTPPAGSPLPWAEAVLYRTKVAAPDLPASAPAGERHRLLGELAADGVVLPPAAWLHLATGVTADKCAAAFAGGLDPARDLLARPDLHDLLAAVPVAGPDSRLSAAGHWAPLQPTAKAAGREAALAALRPQTTTTREPSPSPVRKEAAARYLAYQAVALAASENSANFPLLLRDAALHNRNPAA